ncbi:deoxycytidine kinase 2-like [Lampris incognitus]|uniref:deoxycytidine kinase 2-like n=1 Tax=Lampris incognitus TaxID=2546036 RepID=UPI0024B542A3|nr:deoxycytidine kinase 2-like [Lampris incognitus]
MPCSFRRIVMSALRGVVLSNLVAKLNSQAVTRRHIGFARTGSQCWEAPEPSSMWSGTTATAKEAKSTRKTSVAVKRPLSTSSVEGGTRHVKRVSIEGNIAVGKSTFARLLQSALQDCEVIPEPVSKWQSIESWTSKAETSSGQIVGNLLQMMYQDPQRWSYTFQTYSYLSRLKTQLQPPPDRLLTSEGTPVQIYERSVYSDRYIFALNMFELGCINSAEWAVYQDWHSFTLEHFGCKLELEGIIYLRASPQKCMERLGLRGRAEEKGVERDYLDKLHAQHERWLVEKSTKLHFESLKSVPVLELDANLEFESDPEVRQEFLTKVKNFFSGL